MPLQWSKWLIRCLGVIEKGNQRGNMVTRCRNYFRQRQLQKLRVQMSGVLSSLHFTFCNLYLYWLSFWSDMRNLQRAPRVLVSLLRCFFFFQIQSPPLAWRVCVYLKLIIVSDQGFLSLTSVLGRLDSSVQAIRKSSQVAQGVCTVNSQG